ncbi:hypothetical protein [Xanthobacter aminoxidans]|uniref:hypothetical protein n=1 Tax=Xanthobacter aminoxidans TaxID=186280 RepID=UPI002022C82E|nr:hypothetical protein [Xanthobacter aminoxidans]MCL8384165.1 hypothetical protein [Xanthobacter aminoxidans]
MKIDASILEQLQSLVVLELMKRIQDGTATAGDLATAVRLLKDNGIDARSKDATELDERLGALLPFKPEPPNPDIIG